LNIGSFSITAEISSIENGYIIVSPSSGDSYKIYISDKTLVFQKNIKSSLSNLSVNDIAHVYVIVNKDGSFRANNIIVI
jgi:hypothetical protein